MSTCGTRNMKTTGINIYVKKRTIVLALISRVPQTDDTTTDVQKKWLVLSDNENNEDGEYHEKSELNESQFENNCLENPASFNASNKRWSEEETHKFVKIYLQHDIFRNQKHDFKNNKMRKNAYNKIAMDFEAATGIALTEREVINKIRNLKSTYAQELLKIRRKSNSDFTYVSTLKWFADWDRCYNTKYSHDELRLSDSDDHKVWLELSNNEDETNATQNETVDSYSRTKWSETETLKFVKIYLQYEFLYNPKHKYFRQKKLRHEAYISVSSEFEAATGMKLDEQEIKAKVKILGSTYAQELAKIRKRSDTDNPYSPAMKWFHYWHKYKRVIQQRNAQNSEDDTQETGEISPETLSEDDQKFEPELEETIARESDSDEEVETKRVKLEDDEHSNKIFTNFVDTSSVSEPEDEFDHYGKYIATVLRGMDMDKALQIQLQIQTLLSGARMEDNTM
ncbi:uncharacterized protein LOC106134696 isoform X2 [Amyelois transitella]|uniref:uncharacterized protein LOC106134696 isoform X2 n=1 Tax=Amyelois transitella TaxID=680683 RepID=UPI00299069D7|nr:uncharacterized protein LOC106134696 isoform X2 [Amyelois transitella]